MARKSNCPIAVWPDLAPQLWCKEHAPDYDLRRLETTYNKVLRRYQEEPPAEQIASMPGTEEKGCDNSQVYNHPPTSPPSRRSDQLMGQSLPVPKRPAASKQAAFAQEEKARASLTRNQPEFDKHLDDPQT